MVSELFLYFVGAKVKCNYARIHPTHKTVERKGRVPNGEEEPFGLTLYLARPEQQRDISWNWVLEEFEEAQIKTPLVPKAVVLVECDDQSVYAVSFGHSFFTVDKYCDRDFGFEFARRLKYKEIKTQR